METLNPRVPTAATLVPPPSLPPISSLLAGISSNGEGLGEQRATSFGSLPARGAFGGRNDVSPFSHPLSSSYNPQPTFAPRPPSLASSRNPPPLVSGDSSHERRSDYPPFPLSPEPQVFSQHSQRLPSMQLVSPTGGPLHPRPSGLVGFAPLSPTLLERHSHPPPSYRPRSNSLSMHPYAGPFYGRPLPGYEVDDRRRNSGTERGPSITGSSGAGWPSTPIDSAVPCSSRARKRVQDPLYQPEASSPHQKFAYCRPRASSISSTDEYRPIPAWMDDCEMLANQPTRGGGGSSTQSSPLAGPELKLRPDIMELARDRGLASHPGSSDSLASLVLLGGSSGPSPRLTGRSGDTTTMEQQHHRGVCHITPPDLASLHITTPDSWRGMTMGAPIGTGRFPLPSSGASIHAPNPGSSFGSFAPWTVSATTASAGPGSYSSHLSNPDDGSGDVQMEVGRYACPHCPKRFARPSSLRTHIHSHTGEKPFACELCGRGFSVQSNLRRHLKIHRGSGLTAPALEGGVGAVGADEGEEGEGGGSPSEDGSVG